MFRENNAHLQTVMLSNVLVALEYLKAGRGWCDGEMYDA